MKFKPAILAFSALLVALPAMADARPEKGGKAERVYGGGTGPATRPERRDSLGQGWRQQQDEARRGVRQGRYVPLARVLPGISRRTPGRQLDAGIEENWQGRTVYRIRWAAHNGKRIDYIVDAQSGAILRAEGQ
ncbi:MAG: PepSY domain-containing protein [Caulobacteraceae bacterium]